MKVKTSGIITDLRGTLGNSVASKNKQGLFFRTRVTPRNTFSPLKSLFKGRFSACASEWRHLSQSVKALYADSALSYSFTDNLGNSYTPSGWQLFLHLNINIFPPTSAFLTNPPDYSLLPRHDVINHLPSINPFSYIIDSWALPSADIALKIFVSKFYPASMNLYKVPLTYLTFLDSATVLPIDLGPSIVALAGRQPVQYEKFRILHQPVDKTSGLLSQSDDQLLNVFVW